ncbi:MAG: DNA-processing protein DprA, partial [Chloroflexota bacterium]
MADYPEVVYWLTLINESGLKLNLVKPIIQRWCISDGRPLSGLMELSQLEISSTFGLQDEEAKQILAMSGKLRQQAEAFKQWQSQGIVPIIRTDPRYPSRFAHTLPPAKQPLLLWGQGNLNLLNEPMVGMLGSEDSSEAGSEFVSEMMNALVSEDVGLVSGYGRGLDRTTFEAMLATDGGRAVAVLPIGLAAFAKTTSKLTPALEAQKIALVSPFGPNTTYQEKLAEARNLLIDHLALALLILHTDEESQKRGTAGLDRGIPVFVGLSDTAGNRTLIDQGALLLTDVGEVVEMVQQAMIDATMLDEAQETTPTTMPSAE